MFHIFTSIRNCVDDLSQYKNANYKNKKKFNVYFWKEKLKLWTLIEDTIVCLTNSRESRNKLIGLIKELKKLLAF